MKNRLFELEQHIAQVRQRSQHSFAQAESLYADALTGGNGQVAPEVDHGRGSAITPQAISPTPPTPKANQITLEQLSDIFGATKVRKERQLSGKGVKVAIVDKGCYVQHPYFKKANITVVPVSYPYGALRKIPDAVTDDNGHGTAVVANVLAIAPEAEIYMYKVKSFKSGFEAAVASEAAIISLSIGEVMEHHTEVNDQIETLTWLRDLVRQAKEKGQVIVASCGNYSPQENKALHTMLTNFTDVIGVGGVFFENGKLTASNYAAAKKGKCLPTDQIDLRLPDLCGLCGSKPHAMYIALPTQPGSDFDQLMSNAGDGTAPNDGWLFASGTSSAAPQIAGMCALLKEANPALKLDDMRRILQTSALRREQIAKIGVSADGTPASEEWSLLPEASDAVGMAIARLRGK